MLGVYAAFHPQDIARGTHYVGVTSWGLGIAAIVLFRKRDLSL